MQPPELIKRQQQKPRAASRSSRAARDAAQTLRRDSERVGRESVRVGASVCDREREGQKEIEKEQGSATLRRRSSKIVYRIEC